MWKIIVSVFTFIMIILPGCKSYDMKLLHPDKKINKPLPPLVAEIDIKNLEIAFISGLLPRKPDSHKKNSGSRDTAAGNKQVQNFKDKRIQDAIIVFKREIENNICEPSGHKKYGYAVCRINNRVESSGYWYLVSIPSVGIINFLGLPGDSWSVVMDVEIEILDSQRNRISRYSAIAEDTEYAAMYWGYSQSKNPNSNISRVANTKALLNALKDIKRQIQRDTPKIRKRC